MGYTEQEQAETMKRYIRKVVISEYARNFNKGLSAEDIKFYGKILPPREHVNLLLETQSLEVLNLLYPKDIDYNVLEDEYLEACTDVSFGRVINIPNVGCCTFNGFAEVSYEDRKFAIVIHDAGKVIYKIVRKWDYRKRIHHQAKKVLLT